ncbi:MAG: type II toxin-antitoxin system MqsA family antitoxin [Oscillospiraceae bacterium]|nr:type II toxin-antitoxin system MqsA family antitoxin [Oscillospiraceae bacterium]
MNCFYCKSDMIAGFTTHVAELERCIVIIKHVPCLKCSQCGEIVYTGTTLQKIEKILDKCREAMTEVAIVEYQPAA